VSIVQRLPALCLTSGIPCKVHIAYLVLRQGYTEMFRKLCFGNKVYEDSETLFPKLFMSLQDTPAATFTTAALYWLQAKSFGNFVSVTKFRKFCFGNFFLYTKHLTSETLFRKQSFRNFFGVSKHLRLQCYIHYIHASCVIPLEGRPTSPSSQRNVSLSSAWRLKRSLLKCLFCFQ